MVLPETRLGPVTLPANWALPPLTGGGDVSDAAAGPGREALGEEVDSRLQGLRLLQHLGMGLGLETWSGLLPELATAKGLESLEATLDPSLLPALERVHLFWFNAGGLVALFAAGQGAALTEGLLRIADLHALYPKLKAPLYLIGPEASRARAGEEVRRPLFQLLKKPLGEAISFLPYEGLRAEVEGIGSRLKYLKPEFLEEMAQRPFALAA